MRRKQPRFHQSVGYAWRGILYTLRTQRNPRIHLSILGAVIIAGLYIRLTLQEWALIAVVSGLVLAAENFNSALEELADRVEPNFDPRIMRAKDAAAGGVLITAIVAAIVGILTFGPHLLQICCRLQIAN